MKRALITGGSRGIGQAIAARFRSEGYDVLTPTRAQLDLSSTASIAAYLASAGPLSVDVLVNNAGENKIERLQQLQLADFQRILTTNLSSTLLLMQATTPHMSAQKWGRIVNISSCYSFLSRAGRGAYAASKAGLGGLTRTAALEYGPDGILVNALCPGFVETEMTRTNNDAAKLAELAGQTALGRLAAPEEIAELAYFLGSERNTYLTGQAVVIDGGFSIQ